MFALNSVPKKHAHVRPPIWLFGRQQAADGGSSNSDPVWPLLSAERLVIVPVRPHGPCCSLDGCVLGSSYLFGAWYHRLHQARMVKVEAKGLET